MLLLLVPVALVLLRRTLPLCNKVCNGRNKAATAAPGIHGTASTPKQINAKVSNRMNQRMHAAAGVSECGLSEGDCACSVQLLSVLLLSLQRCDHTLAPTPAAAAEEVVVVLAKIEGIHSTRNTRGGGGGGGGSGAKGVPLAGEALVLTLGM